MDRLKALLLMLLAVLVVAVLTTGTLAAYNRTIDQSGSIHAAKMVFKVNHSGEETQPLGDLELRPGDSKPFDIEIDTEGTEVGLDVALKLDLSGSEIPPGLSVSVDGTGSNTATFSMKGTSRKVPVVVSWNAKPDDLVKLYDGSRDFNLDLSATVTATQANHHQ